MKDMKNDIYVSVIIPVYNAEQYLAECLESVIHQTLKNIEIICVDDGSTDGSFMVMQDYALKDSRISLIRQENKGVSAARNKGIERAKGEYIAFLDSDDYLEHNAYKRAYKEATAKKAEILVFGGDTFPYKNWADEKLKTRRICYNQNSVDALFHETGSRPFSVNKLYKRSLLNEIFPVFDEHLSLGEDMAFLFDVFPLAGNIVYINDILYHYRQHSSSAMSVYDEDIEHKVKAHLEIINHVVRNWSDKGYAERYGKDLTEWMIQFFKNDLTRCRYNAKIAYTKIIVTILNELSISSELDSQYQQQLDTMREWLEVPGFPRVSVIMPVYNAEQYLDETLKCLTAQTYLNFEIIFVDDGSTDNSVRILSEFAQNDSRAKILHQQHGYAGVARNYGMEYAKGEYLLFLDSDDFFLPNMIRKAVEKADRTDADICVFLADRFDQVTKRKSHMPWTCRAECFSAESEVFSRHMFAQYIYCFTTPAPWNKLFRASFVFENKLFFQNTRSANDMAFVMTALAAAEKITIVDEVLITYRVNNSQSLQGSQAKKADAFYDALLELKGRLLDRGLYMDIEPAFINFALDFCIYNLKTMSTLESFEDVFYLLKEKAFEELDLIRWPKEYFYAYKSNHIYENREDIRTLSPIEYLSKYKLLSFAEPTDSGTDSYEGKASSTEVSSVTHTIWFVRKVIGGFKCLRDNGFRYTIRRLGQKIKGRLMR